MYKDTRFLSLAYSSVSLSILKMASLLLLTSLEECARLLAVEFIETSQVLLLALAFFSLGVGVPAKGILYRAMVLCCGTCTVGRAGTAA